MIVKEIVIRDFEEIMAELREVLAQFSVWCQRNGEYLPV